MTRKYAVQAFQSGPDSNIHQQLVDVVMETLVNILVSAGLDTAAAEISESVVAQFTGHASEVVKQATHLNSIINQNITSSDLAPLYVVPDTLFDQETMEDGFASNATDELILCATDLGITKTEKVDRTWHKKILKKPKVALQSGLVE